MPDIAIHPDKPGIEVGGRRAKLFRLCTENGACQEDFPRLKAAVRTAHEHFSDGGKIDETWIDAVFEDGCSILFLSGSMITACR